MHVITSAFLSYIIDGEDFGKISYCEFSFFNDKKLCRWYFKYLTFDKCLKAHWLRYCENEFSFHARKFEKTRFLNFFWICFAKIRYLLAVGKPNGKSDTKMPSQIYWCEQKGKLDNSKIAYLHFHLKLSLIKNQSMKVTCFKSVYDIQSTTSVWLWDFSLFRENWRILKFCSVLTLYTTGLIWVIKRILSNLIIH